MAERNPVHLTEAELTILRQMADDCQPDVVATALLKLLRRVEDLERHVYGRIA